MRPRDEILRDGEGQTVPYALPGGGTSRITYLPSEAHTLRMILEVLLDIRDRLDGR